MQKYLFYILLLLFFVSCEGFLGKKTSTDFLEAPNYNDNTVAYVPIQPALTGFVNPTDIVIGFDEQIYIADSGTSKILAFDQAGQKTGEFTVPYLTSLVQDRQLNILALGRKDTLINGVSYKLPAIYRLDLNNAGPYGLNHARIKHVSIFPFCFNPAAIVTAKDELVSFESVAILASNKYYVARRGPDASGTIYSDAVLSFDTKDNFVSPIFVTTSFGTQGDYFKEPKSLTTYVQPPQAPNLSTKGDFIYTSFDANLVLKVQAIQLKESDAGASYEFKELASVDTSKAKDAIYRPYHFSQPSDITMAGDGTGYIFVADAAKDSIFQFNGLGFEGVNAPAGSNSKKSVFASFGGTGTGLTQFRRPTAVAYFNKILYVADAGNQRVLRFQLTTDFR